MSLSSDITRIKAAKAAIKAAINAKGGTLTDELLDAYAAAVEAISTGIDTSDATAVTGDILAPKTAYVNGVKLTGSMTDNTGITEPVSFINWPTGQLIYANIPANGYYPTSVSIGNTYAHFASLIGLTAAKIVSGNTILGVSGTGGGDSMWTTGGVIVKMALPQGITELPNNMLSKFTALLKIWIPSSVTTITGQDGASPFFGLSQSAVIYCEAASKPAGWTALWNRISAMSTPLTTNWSTSRSAFDAL